MSSQDWQKIVDRTKKYLPHVLLAVWGIGFAVHKLLPDGAAIHILIGSTFVIAWLILVAAQDAKKAAEETRDSKIVALTKNIQAVHCDGFGDTKEIFKNTRYVDMAAINFYGLLSHKDNIIKYAIPNGARIRVALLRPGCEAFKVHMADAKSQDDRKDETRLAITVLNALTHIQEAIDLHNSTAHHKASMEIYYYTRNAYCGLIITDTMVRYWPYLHESPVNNSPTFDYPVRSELYSFYRKHLDLLMQEKIELGAAKLVAKDWDSKN